MLHETVSEFMPVRFRKLQKPYRNFSNALQGREYVINSFILSLILEELS